jgi:hypothetical protein
MNDSSPANLDRRKLFHLFGFGALTLVGACQRSSDVRPEPVPDPSEVPTRDEATSEAALENKPDVPEDAVTETTMNCAEGVELSEKSKQLREELAYTPKSSNGQQRCSYCKLWEPPADGKGLCGGCQLFSGPVNANGYCVGFVPLKS